MMRLTRRTYIPAALDWRWPFSWYVREGEQPPFDAWLTWHYHCLLEPLT